MIRVTFVSVCPSVRPSVCLSAGSRVPALKCLAPRTVLQSVRACHGGNNTRCTGNTSPIVDVVQASPLSCNPTAHRSCCARPAPGTPPHCIPLLSTTSLAPEGPFQANPLSNNPTAHRSRCARPAPGTPPHCQKPVTVARHFFPPPPLTHVPASCPRVVNVHTSADCSACPRGQESALRSTCSLWSSPTAAGAHHYSVLFCSNTTN